MEMFIVAVLIGLLPATIAKGKGKSFGLWWFYGAARCRARRFHTFTHPAWRYCCFRQ